MIPALAVADALRDSGAEVEFIGGERAEAELVPAAGYPLHRLSTAGIDRRSPVRAARAVALAGAATVRARGILGAMGADACIGGGGYAAGPVGLAAVTRRIPLLLTEADSHLGLSNRLLAPVAKRVCLAFALPGRDGAKYVVTGRPVPAGTGAVDRDRARARFGLVEDAPVLLVFGGSLGARSLNEAAIEALAPAAPCAVLHVCGRRDHPDLAERLEAMGSPSHYRLLEFVEPFADALAAADLAVARAGGSVFELAAAGLPAILVPYPHATAGHQEGNARWMADAGAAVVVGDRELDGPRLAREVGALLAAPDRLATMARAARRIAMPEAANRIAAEALALAGRRG